MGSLYWLSDIMSQLMIFMIFLVYGFLKTRIVGSERGQGYPIQIGYLKGTGGVIRGRIEEVPGGNAGNDYCF